MFEGLVKHLVRIRGLGASSVIGVGTMGRVGLVKDYISESAGFYSKPEHVINSCKKCTHVCSG